MHSKTTKDQVAWCLKKAREALDDYDAVTATNYIELAQQWLAKGG